MFVRARQCSKKEALRSEDIYVVIREGKRHMRETGRTDWQAPVHWIENTSGLHFDTQHSYSTLRT